MKNLSDVNFFSVAKRNDNLVVMQCVFGKMLNTNSLASQQNLNKRNHSQDEIVMIETLKPT